MTREADRSADLAFADRYMITSVRGRVYTRSMLLAFAMRDAVAKLATPRLTRAELAAVLDDHAFMRSRRGMVPIRVAEDVTIEALIRRPPRE